MTREEAKDHLIKWHDFMRQSGVNMGRSERWFADLRVHVMLLMSTLRKCDPSVYEDIDPSRSLSFARVERRLSEARRGLKTA